MNGCAEQTEKVISHILEIIYLMTGEEYMIMKKPPLYKVSENLHQARKSVLEIPADSPVHVRKRSGSHPASRVTSGMPGEAQKEFLDSAFQPPPGVANVQIKCDDVAMYLSVEEWEYLEHHKEEYEVLIGKNQSPPAVGPKGQCLQESSLVRLDSEQRDCNSDGTMEETNTMDWNTENKFTAPTVSYIRACEDNSSPNRESSDKIYRPKNMTETWDSTQSRDVFTLQNNLTLNHGPLSEMFLVTEIKEEQTNIECVMEDCEGTMVRSNTSNQMDSPSLMDGHQIKTVNDSDSSFSNYTLEFIPQSFSENPRPHTSILDGHQAKMAEFTGLLDGHTLDHVQSPFGDVLQRKHITKGLTHKGCSTAGQGTRTIEVSDFSQETNHSLSFINLFKALPQQTHTRTELQNQESSTDGHQTKKVDLKDCRLKNADTESISNNFQNVYEKANLKKTATYQTCSLDETTKVEINDSLVEGSEALYQLSSSFSEAPQRTCIKTELVHQEHSTNGLQKNTMDKINSGLVERHILGCDTSTLKSHGKSKLTYQESLRHSQHTNAVEVNHSLLENHSSLSTDWQTNNKPLTPLDYHYSIQEPAHHSKNGTRQSTGRVQSRSKPQKMISCGDCGKVFSSKSYLSRHQRLHTGEKPFTCSECGKSFSWMSSLVTHKRTHLGEKPFSCKQCGKRFSDYSGIIKHRRSHTGEKPYTCLLCGECFAQTYQLVKHQAVHFSEDVAEKSFHGR